MTDYHSQISIDLQKGRAGLAISAFVLVFFIAGSACICAASLSMDHEAKIAYNVRGMRVPQWAGGALVAFDSNRTSTPVLLSFDDQGNQFQAIPFTIPNAEMIDLDDITRGLDGSLAICGKAFDHSGSGSGFVAVIGANADKVTTVRLYPYEPVRIAIGSDGTIWTVGLMVVNGKEGGPANSSDYDVIRHFDRSGKLLDSFVPRSSIGSHFAVQNSRLRSASGRIGWYPGPSSGASSRFREIRSDGTVRIFPAILLAESESITGLALTDDGKTYVTTWNKTNHGWQFLSTNSPDNQWTQESAPPQLTKARLFGSDGSRLVFYTYDRFTLAFVTVSH